VSQGSLDSADTEAIRTGRRHLFLADALGRNGWLRADRFGNLLYSKAARNFAPVMATAADLVAVEADELVELGALDPECVVTPGIFVDRVVRKGSSP